MIPIYGARPSSHFPGILYILYHSTNIQLHLLVHVFITPTLLSCLGVGNEYLGHILCLAHGTAQHKFTDVTVEDNNPLFNAPPQRLVIFY